MTDDRALDAESAAGDGDASQDGPEGDIEDAIHEFRAALPGWWFTVGSCSVSRDASCGPDNGGGHSAEIMERFDDGFHCDDATFGSTLADSLRNVAAQARAALDTPPNG